MGGDGVGGTVGAVDDDLETFKRERLRKRRLEVHDEAALGVVDAGGAADVFAGGLVFLEVAGLEDQALELFFDSVRQLEAVVAEDLDAVVLIGVVARRHDDAGVGAHRARDEGDTGGGQRSGEHDIDAHRGDARADRLLDHVARQARVFADHDTTAVGGGHRHER